MHIGGTFLLAILIAHANNAGNALEACNASSIQGIRWLFSVPDGFIAQPNQGFDVSDAPGGVLLPGNHPTWGDKLIPESVQGQLASSADDCNCRCANTSHCVGYVWQPFSQSCWLQSHLELYVKPGQRYLRTDGSGRASAERGTVVAKVVLSQGTPWYDCTAHTMVHYTGYVPSMTSSQGITRYAGPVADVSPAVCNAQCAVDPACVAFIMEDMNGPQQGTCRLLSQARGGLITAKVPDIRLYPVQSCEAPREYLPGNATTSTLLFQDAPLEYVLPGPGWFEITSFGLCVSAPAAGNGKTELQNCSTAADVKTQLFLQPTGTGNSFNIMTDIQGKSHCMSVYNGGAGRNRDVIFARCMTGRQDQAWTARRNQDSPVAFRFVPSHAPGGVLEVSETENVTAGEDVRMTVDSGDISQMFGLRPIVTGRPPISEPPEEAPTVVPADIIQGGSVSHLLARNGRCIATPAAFGGIPYLSECVDDTALLNYTFVRPADLAAGSDGYYIQVSGITAQGSGSGTSTKLCWTVNYTQSDLSEFVTLEECGVQGRQQLWSWEACFDSPGRFRIFTVDNALRTLDVKGGDLKLNDKVQLHGINGEDNQCFLVSTTKLMPPPPRTNTRSPTGRVIGIIVGTVVAVIAAAAVIIAIVLVRRKRRNKAGQDAQAMMLDKGKGIHIDGTDFTWSSLLSPRQHGSGASHGGTSLLYPTNDTQNTLASVLSITGLVKGDPFTKGTAQQYRWISKNQVPDIVTSIEAGISDHMLTNSLASSRIQNDSAATPTAPDTAFENAFSNSYSTGFTAVELSHKDVISQIELLEDGLLGKGGTCLVFKGRWVDKFGPGGLVAVKVMKDAYDMSLEVLQSFSYEAQLLAKLKHPNIVRMYGYCLELPTVCLILELLPTSLEALLHPAPSVMTNTNTAQHASSGSAAAAATSSSNKINNALIYPPVSTVTDNATTTAIFEENERNEGSDMHTLNSPVNSHVDHSLSTEQPSSSSHISTSNYVYAPDQASFSKFCPLGLPRTVQVLYDITKALTYLHTRSGSEEPTCTVVTEDIVTGGGSDILNSTLSTIVGMDKGGRIAHRDLKPGNVLLNSKGVAKLSDFGLARKHASTTVHTVHAGAGTLVYMAPELLNAGMRDVIKPTNRVDIYSLGIMMWELLSGDKPWRHIGAEALMVAVRSGQRPMVPSSWTTLHKINSYNTFNQDSSSVTSAPAGDADSYNISQSAGATIASAPTKKTKDVFEGSSSHSVPDDVPQPYRQVVCQLTSLMRSCWRQRDLKRPAAHEVHAVMDNMMRVLSGEAA